MARRRARSRRQARARAKAPAGRCADPEARATAEVIDRGEPDRRAASATQTVDALLPLWFALVKQNGGDRKVALRIVR